MTVVQIVEDNRDVAQMLSLLLQINRPDLEVRSHTDDFNGVFDTVLWADVDIGVIDLMLPGVDGRTIVTWLAEHAPHVRRVVYSAIVDPTSGPDDAHAVLTKTADYRSIVAALGLD